MLSSKESADAFRAFCEAYQSTEQANNLLHAEFTRLAWADPLLAAHRKHVEDAKLGFGDPAFHHLWHLLLAASSARFGAINAMEIGVFKGQVISLWALLGATHNYDLKIHAVTPLEGQPMPSLSLWLKIRYRIDRKFRDWIASGNFYPVEDYEAIVRQHFDYHGQDFSKVNVFRGFSTNDTILQRTKDLRLELLYIDGDHTYEGALFDIEHYSQLVVPGGWLVMDDAAFDQPGSTFWKGYESVSRACLRLPELGFKNVLSVGHNRVFERMA